MSIRFNHPQNTIDASGSTVIFNANGGTPNIPINIKFNASSLIVPNVEEPRGERGALIYDVRRNVMKYHNGIEWIEWASKPDIVEQIDTSLKDIYKRLDTKIDTVTYSSSTIPTASISGTTLNIVFPSSNSDKPETSGLYTSLPTGSISYYSLSSGQNFASIREQMGGKIGSQNGRTGTQANPYVTETGWCLSDGKYWLWKGASGNRIIQTPNLNVNNYLKSITENTTTNTNNIVQSGGSVSNTTVKVGDHYHATGMMMAEWDKHSADDGAFIFGRTFPGDYVGTLICGTLERGRQERDVNGKNKNTALSTSLSFSEDGGKGHLESTHNHSINNLEVQHLKVAVLYNIAIPEKALNESDGNKLFVKKTGDVMTGSLEVKDQLIIKGGSTLLQIPFRNTAGTEISTIFVDSRDKSVNIRAGLNDVLKVAPNNKLTFNGNPLVQTINNTKPDTNGNIDVAGIPIGAVVMWFTDTPPADFIEVNGRFDVNKYPKLAKLYPDGVIPDMRGVFPRGWDHGRGLDSGRSLKSYQDDALQEHIHDLGVETTNGGDDQGRHRNVPGGFDGRNGRSMTGKVIDNVRPNEINEERFNARTSDETRPKNVAVMYIMRAN